MGRPCPPRPLFPPPPSFVRIISIVYASAVHSLSPTLSRKGIRGRANDHRDTNQGEARSLVIDRPPETFFSSSSSFEANVRTTFDPVMILESRAFPSIPSSSKKIFFTGFFLYLFLQRYRGGRVTKKARLIFSGSSAILIYRCREGVPESFAKGDASLSGE